MHTFYIPEYPEKVNVTTACYMEFWATFFVTLVSAGTYANTGSEITTGFAFSSVYFVIISLFFIYSGTFITWSITVGEIVYRILVSFGENCKNTSRIKHKDPWEFKMRHFAFFLIQLVAAYFAILLVWAIADKDMGLGKPSIGPNSTPAEAFMAQIIALTIHVIMHLYSRELLLSKSGQVIPYFFRASIQSFIAASLIYFVAFIAGPDLTTVVYIASASITGDFSNAWVWIAPFIISGVLGALISFTFRRNLIRCTSI